MTEPSHPEPPAEWTADAVLRDGTVVSIRPIEPADRAALTTFHETLSSRTVYLKHALRVALNPLISTIGLSLPTVLMNALLVGFMFGIPTYGSLLKAAIERQDPALLASMMVFYSFVLVVGNLLADIGLAAADPRIRYD